MLNTLTTGKTPLKKVAVSAAREEGCWKVSFPAGMATVTHAAGLGGSLTPVSQVSGPVEADGIHAANTEPCLCPAWCWALDEQVSRQV